MDDQLTAISEEIFQYAVAQLTLSLRFMDIALNRYALIPDSPVYRCDGTFFHYPPVDLIKTFRQCPQAVTRGYLHVVLHSVFLHPRFAQNRKMSLWNLACDIAVENVILNLGLACTRLMDDDKKKRIIEELKEKTPEFTAQRLYHVLENMEADQIKIMAPLFYFDDHECWYQIRDVQSSSDTLFGEENRDDPSADSNNRFEKASHDTGERKESCNQDAEDAETELMRNELTDWEKISEKLEEQLENFKKEYGEQTEPMVQSLRRLHREKYSYTEFLKKFMSMGEKLQISDEDFDAIFYTYGLQLYKNLPLIEPLEYREISNVREIIIAIDTSGSVQGDVVQGFLQKTWNIFSQRENFFSRFNIHIVQCDLKIRDAVVLTSAKQFEKYIEDLEIKGFSGTDFRPVFAYADEQLKNGRFRKFKGILYFTDGDGIYPAKKPAYPAAFLFPSSGKDIKVPPWAIKYNLQEDIYAYQEGEEPD